MRGRTYLLLASLLVPAVLAAPSQAQDPAPPLVQTVAGIISFTRWPAPSASVTLCIVGPAEGTDAFFAAPILAGSVPVRPRRMAVASDQTDGCNAVYAGRLSLSDLRQLNRKLEGLAVLTMAEATPDCTDLIMFCFRIDKQAVTFSTNIDMIARGGVRLNPRVLLLGRKPAGAAP